MRDTVHAPTASDLNLIPEVTHLDNNLFLYWKKTQVTKNCFLKRFSLCIDEKVLRHKTKHQIPWPYIDCQNSFLCNKALYEASIVQALHHTTLEALHK